MHGESGFLGISGADLRALQLFKVSRIQQHNGQTIKKLDFLRNQAFYYAKHTWTEIIGVEPADFKCHPGVLMNNAVTASRQSCFAAEQMPI